jgi:phosphomannomutase
MEMIESESGSLASRLSYSPQELRFGTSGRRGEVVHLTQLEIYINAFAELTFLQGLPESEGGIVRGQEFYFASDLRPSSTSYVVEQGGRGEIAQAILRAILDSGMRPVYLGRIPTPALAYFALSRHRGSMMITGSHIPFNRNGYKTNTSQGELLKKHEQPIGDVVLANRERLYAQPIAESIFDESGLFKVGHSELPAENPLARKEYVERYTEFFEGLSLAGKKLLVYQHSAVGRDLIVDLLLAFGADVIAAGRSDTFVPIDTENIDAGQLAIIQTLVDQAIETHGPVFAVISLDGDSDRPLVLGVDPMTSRVRFFGGDLVGMVAAEYLGADAVVVPISCNDGIDRGSLAKVLEPKTRIGSPYVIAGMETAGRKNRRVICGWEANGGFLTGSDIQRKGRILRALPTRDAMLPILCTLFSAIEKDVSLPALYDKLPHRFSRAALLKQFPRVVSERIVRRFSPAATEVQDVFFQPGKTIVADGAGRELQTASALPQELEAIRRDLQSFFKPELGFTPIAHLNYTDGVRIVFENGDVAHLRPSGNAEELRIYAVADTLERAEQIASAGIGEPGGILRSMQISVDGLAGHSISERKSE